MEYVNIVVRTTLFYFIITIVYRFMGKREVAQLSIFDLTVSILIAELAAMSIEKSDESIFLTLIPIIILVLIQMLMSYISMKKPKIRNLLDGEPSVIINKGVINFKEMVRQRYNLDDLLTQLREKQIRSIEEVDYAVLETSGNLSVFYRKDNEYGNYPFPLILDGAIQKETLNALRKTENWVKKILKEKQIKLEDIFYAFYKGKNVFIIKKDSLDN